MALLATLVAPGDVVTEEAMETGEHLVSPEPQGSLAWMGLRAHPDPL